MGRKRKLEFWWEKKVVLSRQDTRKTDGFRHERMNRGVGYARGIFQKSYCKTVYGDFLVFTVYMLEKTSPF